MADDFELLAAWQAGDKQAASTLLRRHFSRVYQFFRSKLDDQVDDLTQRTFMAAVEQPERLANATSFKAYLLGIARKQLLMHLRTRHRRDKRFELMEISAVDAGASPSQVVAVGEEQHVLLSALRQIPLDLQMAIELFYWEEMTTEEIGVVLEIPGGTVRSRLRRGRELLREAITKVAADPQLAESTIQNLDQWAASLRGVLARGSKPEA